MRLIFGAISCALLLAAAGAPVRADGTLNSLSDLDGGAQDWHAIAPGGSADAKPVNPLPSAPASQGAPQPATSSRGVTRIDAHLAIEQAPPPPKKPVPSLWFEQQAQGK